LKELFLFIFELLGIKLLKFSFGMRLIDWPFKYGGLLLDDDLMEIGRGVSAESNNKGFFILQVLVFGLSFD
jgi:hypothetical protein